MGILSLALGGAATGSALNTFSYNRNAWMNDVQVNQARRYQRQQVRLSQAEMFREDIRDLVGAAVTKQSNYVLIATLILGMIAECYVEGPMPDGASEFVASVYMLCVGSSLLYLVMSVLCAVSATNLASSCQKDLLTTLVRLPVDEFVKEIDEAGKLESTEAFEHQAVSRMLRLPGLSRMRQGPASPDEAVAAARRLARSASGRSETAHFQLRRANSEGSLRSDRLYCEESGSTAPSSAAGPASADDQAESAERHLDVFHEKEREWEVLGSCAFVFGVMGTSHLLQAYGYYSASKFYTGSTWASWIVQLLVVLVDAILTRVYMSAYPIAGAIGSVLNITAPVACTFAIRYTDPVWVDQVCIPLCFVCHLLLNTFGFVQLVGISRGAAGANAPCSFPGRPTLRRERTFADAVAMPQRLKAVRGKDAVARADRLARSATALKRRQNFFLVFLGSGVVMLAWLITVGWSVFHACIGDGDNGMVIAGPRQHPSAHRHNRSVLGLPVRIRAPTTEVAVTWPSTRFRPKHVACAAGGKECYFANEHLIFKVRHTTDDALGSPRRVPCRSLGEIVGIAAAPCPEGEAGSGEASSDGACGVFVLSREAGGPISAAICVPSAGTAANQVTSGGAAAGGVAAAGGPGPRLFAVLPSPPGSSGAFGLAEGGKVTEYAVGGGLALRPLWPVAEIPNADSVVAIGAIAADNGGNSLLATVRVGGALDVMDADTGRTCASWAVGGGDHPDAAVAGAAVTGNGRSLLVLLAAPAATATRVLRADVPGLPAACGRGGAAADAAAVSPFAAPAGGQSLRGAPGR